MPKPCEIFPAGDLDILPRFWVSKILVGSYQRCSSFIERFLCHDMILNWKYYVQRHCKHKMITPVSKEPQSETHIALLHICRAKEGKVTKVKSQGKVSPMIFVLEYCQLNMIKILFLALKSKDIGIIHFLIWVWESLVDLLMPFLKTYLTNWMAPGNNRASAI